MATKKSVSSTRRFRSDIAKLKKAGVIPAKVDARKVKPTRHYKAVVKDNLALVNGRQRAVKVDKQKATALRKQGYKVLNNRVVLDKLPGQTIRANKKSKYGFSVTDHSSHTTRLDVPPAETTRRRITKFRKLKIDKKPNSRFYATLYGNQTLMIFKSQDELADYLLSYGDNSEDFAENITFYETESIIGSWYQNRASKSRKPVGRKPPKK